MAEQNHLEQAAEFGRQQAAQLEATMEAKRAEAASLGFDGVVVIQAAFAAAPTLTPAAERLFGRSAAEPIPVRRARPRLVYSRD